MKNVSREISILSYPILFNVQYTTNAVPSVLPVFDVYDETIPDKVAHSTIFNHRMMAPPAAPQVSGRVIQASVWKPRSIHCLLVWFKVQAEFTWFSTKYENKQVCFMDSGILFVGG